MAFATKMRTRIRRLLARPATVDLGKYEDLLSTIEWREKKLVELGDDELTKAAGALRDKIDDLPLHEDDLVELCALGREAGRRALDERAHDVQLLGTMAMLNGNVVEMATGEGKTLSGALAAAGYALAGRDVHVLSVNDYLARRDAEWMGPVLRAARRERRLGQPGLDARGAPRRLRQRGDLRRGQRGRLRRAARPPVHLAPTSWCSRPPTSPWSTRPTRCSSTRPRCRW